MKTFKAEPPVMADYGNEILALDPHSNGDRAPLPEALMDALSQVLFLAGMKAMDIQMTIGMTILTCGRPCQGQADRDYKLPCLTPCMGRRVEVSL